MSRIKPHQFLKELTCLYVEDNEFIRESFSMLISRYFKEVVIASNGEEGYEKFLQVHPDIIISDIRMPVMDGLDMVKKIKEHSPDIFVIFTTAFTDIEYLKQAIDLGVEGYITKPVDKQKLLKKLNLLAQFLKQQRDSQELLELLESIFNKQPNPTVLIDGQAIKLANSAFKLMFGFTSADEFFEQFPLDLSKTTQEITIQYEDKSVTFEVHIQKLGSKLLVVLNDISSLENQILTDSLTKLYNRKILAKVLPSLESTRRCLLMMDIDHFKQINDNYGHLVGDRVLVQLSELLKNSIRRDDILIRWGGEEFLLILDNVSDIDIAYKVANSLRHKIEEFTFDFVERVTCSFGVCCGVISQDSFEMLVEKADKALYGAKQTGRNKVIKSEEC
ncbi:MAG: diguanylate cyclase [Epsilonproteobacteria bacterium]|nr:diguanylate cyclase [Campylobacterota bacterium]